MCYDRYCSMQVLYTGIVYRYCMQVLYTYIHVLCACIVCRYCIHVLCACIVCRYCVQVLYTCIVLIILTTFHRNILPEIHENVSRTFASYLLVLRMFLGNIIREHSGTCSHAGNILTRVLMQGTF